MIEIPVVQTGRNVDAGRPIDPRSRIDTRVDPRPGLQFLANLADERRTETERVDRLRAMVARSRNKVGVETGLAALDPMDADYDARVEEIIRNNRDAALREANIQTPAISDELAATFDAEGIQYGGAALLRRRSSVQRETAQAFEELQTAFLARLAADPDNADALVSEFQSTVGEALTNIDPENRSAVSNEFERKTAAAIVGGLMDAGRFDDARAAADRFAETLGPERVRAMKQTIFGAEQQASNNALIETQREVADFGAAIQNSVKLASSVTDSVGQGQAPISVLDQSEEQLRQLQERFVEMDVRGIFNGRAAQRSAQATAISTAISETRALRRRVNGVLLRFSDGQGVVGEAEANIAWNDFSARTLPPDANFSDVASALGRFSVSAGAVPSAAKGIIEQASRSGDPGQVAAGAQLLDTVTALNPAIEVPANTIMRSAMSLIRYAGIDPQAAAELALQATDPSVQKSREEALKQVSDNTFSAETITEVLNEAGGVFGSPSSAFPLSGRGPTLFENTLTNTFRLMSPGALLSRSSEQPFDIPDAMQAAYRKAYEETFRATGDEQVAQRAAIRTTSERWGASVLFNGSDGQPILSEFPPERYTMIASAGSDGRFSIDAREAGEILTARLDEALTARGIGPEQRGALSLRASPTARFDLAAGRLPTYTVFVTDPVLGLPRPLLENGRPVLYHLPTQGQLLNDPRYRRITGQSER